MRSTALGGEISYLVVHFEIHASDPQSLVDFYTDLLGWSFQQFGDMPYWSIGTGEGSVTNDTADGTAGFGINGGLTQRSGPRPVAGAPVNGSNIVVAVDDVDGLFEKALRLGATAAVEPDTMPGVGRLAYLHDPDGNVFGLIAPSM